MHFVITQDGKRVATQQKLGKALSTARKLLVNNPHLGMLFITSPISPELLLLRYAEAVYASAIRAQAAEFDWRIIDGPTLADGAWVLGVDPTCSGRLLMQWAQS
jgi:hypothetical protein